MTERNLSASDAPGGGSPCAPVGNGDGKGMGVLVTGGAGYLGSVLCAHLVERGHRVRVLDPLFWGREPLASVADRVDVVVADVRDAESSHLDGVETVVHLGGLSNDPTAEFDPETNWEVNALATRGLANLCLSRGLEHFIFASSCSLYDGLGSGLHDESAPVVGRGAYSKSKLWAESALLDLRSAGLSPVIMRMGTICGWSPRMRFDLMVNTFVKDALICRRLTLHAGGWMRRPLVRVEDAAGSIVLALEAPRGGIDLGGEVFNIVQANHSVRDVAQMTQDAFARHAIDVEIVEAPSPRLVRDYSCSNEKLARSLGFTPPRSVEDAIEDVLGRVIHLPDPRVLDDPRYYNIDWMRNLRSESVERGDGALQSL